MLVASDGSTDGTVEVARAASDRDNIRVLAFSKNRGKISALNDAVREARGEFVVFSDAAAQLQPDCIRHNSHEFRRSSRRSCGWEIRIHRASQAGMGSQEKSYWDYETFIKAQESAISSVLGGHGQLLAVRSKLYPHPPSDTINDDYVIPLEIIAKGFRVVYEPQAIAEEDAAEMSGFQEKSSYNGRKPSAIARSQETIVATEAASSIFLPVA